MTKTNTAGRRPVTVPRLRAMKNRGEKITMVTAYDATFAQMLEEGGAEMLLVGDSLGMVIQGLDTTLPVTVDEVIYHCRAVSRASRTAHIVGDMPFMSFQGDAQRALMNAGRFLKEGGAHSVKLEGGVEVTETIELLVSAGIPVVGHVGLTPQSVHAMGGFRVQGRSVDAAARVLADAIAVEEGGAFAIVLEGIPTDLAKEISECVSIPTIGIGAGPHCDGQVLVSYDLLGLTANLRPRFVKRYATFYDDGVQATATFVAEVRSGAFPQEEHAFGNVKRTSLGANAGGGAPQPERVVHAPLGYDPEV